MDDVQKLDFIVGTLQRLYPEPEIPLKYTDTYSFLIAVLLSAQCTDERVNKTTPMLFSKARNPREMMALGITAIQEIIKPCGLSNNKSKAIYNLSDILINQHHGEVPSNFHDLEALPGVGHKTASVVMSQIFGVPAFPVDTHIHRLAKRWKISDGKSVVKTEVDLKKFFPEHLWNKLHLQMIYYGRNYCKAKSHNEDECLICKNIKQ
ncbi:MAG: endonuclease III [Saprospiraceae bacterium]|nr:endonuclease III [Saprospiraceae bacterium]